MKKQNITLNVKRDIINFKHRGVNKHVAAKQLSLSYSTIHYWWNREALVAQSAEAMDSKSMQCQFESDQGYHAAYSFILGCYLGDGYVKKVGPVFRMEIYQDLKYPKTLNIYRQSLQTLFPANKIFITKTSHCAIVNVYSKKMVDLFPQSAGAGEKWKRDVGLLPWQQIIIEKYPREFLKGLVWTDGCRSISNKKFKSGQCYQYIEYAFTNKSKQIFEMFLECCRLLNLSPSKPHVDKTGIRRCKISNRKDVNLLDEFIGIKI